mgnify:FL=1
MNILIFVVDFNFKIMIKNIKDINHHIIYDVKKEEVSGRIKAFNASVKWHHNNNKYLGTPIPEQYLDYAKSIEDVKDIKITGKNYYPNEKLCEKYNISKNCRIYIAEGSSNLDELLKEVILDIEVDKPSEPHYALIKYEIS